MIGFLKSLFSLLANIIIMIEKYHSNKKSVLDRDQHSKAEAYDNLQKALKARSSVRKSIATDSFMSDDGYQRK